MEPPLFAVMALDDTPIIRWHVSGAPDVAGFNVYRSGVDADVLERVNASMIDVRGEQTADLDVTDSKAIPGERYAYWLEVVDTMGRSRISGPIEFTAPRSGSR